MRSIIPQFFLSIQRLEKIFLFLWILACVIFYVTLDSQVLSFILPDFPLRPVLLSLLGIGGLFLFSKGNLRFFKNPFFVFPIPLLAISAFFLKKFPLATFSWLVFQDDFTSLYGASLRTLQMIKEGTLFGWDSHLLGGYYTVSDINFNLGLFLWPFYTLFSPPVGFHVFIFLLYLSFPFLVYAVARTWNEEREIAGMAFWLSSFFAISFFRNFLLWGNIDNLLGLDLFLLAMISLKKSQKHPWAFFGLAFLLVLLAYAHLAYFLYALFVVGLAQFFPLYRKRKFFFCLVGIVVLFAVFPYAVHFLRHPDFFDLDAKHYKPIPIGFEEASAQSLQKISRLAKGSAWVTAGYEGVHGGNYGAATVLFLPMLVYLFWNQKKSRLLIGSIFLILCLLPLKTGMALALKRTYFLLPILLSLALAQGLKVFSKRSTFSALVLIPTLLLGTVGLPSRTAISHQPTLESFFPALYRRLPSMDGHTIFLETQSIWIETDTGQKGSPFPGPHVHMEILLALETGKRFLSHGKDGYPFSIYRKNCLMSGIWAGKFLNEHDVWEVNAFLKKWGVRHMVVWSGPANDFFSGHPDFYETVWKDNPWTLFRFKEADPRFIVLRTGEGEMTEQRYTRISVHLKGVRQGDEAVVRMNHHPDFRASSEGRALSLYSKDGQIAFKIPRDGDMTVLIRYPGYSFLYLLGLLGIGLFGVIVWRKA